MKQKLSLCFFLAAITVFGQDFSRWSAHVQGGPTFPLSETSNRVNTGFNIGAGGGFNFSEHFGLNIDYTFNELGLSNQVLQNADAPGGYAHVWGFTANPIWYIAPERKVGGYITAGYGVFTRTTNLTRPTTIPGLICDPWGFYCYVGPIYADQIYSSHSTTKGGWNVGGGVTYRLGEGRAKLFAEVRYYEMLTSNIKTRLMPLSFGIRW